MRRAFRSVSLLALVAVLGAATIAVAAELDAFDAVRAAVAGDQQPQAPEPEVPPEAERGAKGAELGASGPVEGDYVEGRVLVRFKRGVSPREKVETVEEVDGEPVADIGATTVVELTGDTEVPEAVEELDANPDVAYVEPDYLRRFDACADCWQLGPNGADVLAVHQAGRRGAGAVVAVIDTGVDDSLPDLAGQVISKKVCTTNGCTNGGTAGPHGTMVASIIAAKDNSTGITGVAPAARVKSWKVDTGGPNPGIPTSYVLAALRDVADDPDVDIVNLSFSGEERSEAEAEAVAALIAKGKTVVASAGNDGSYVPRYPAGYQGVIAVGAADANGNVPGWSSFGKVDVLAPGVCVAALAPAGSGGDGGCGPSQPGVVRATGTSFSAPVVAGILALRSGGNALRERLAVLGTASGIDGLNAEEAKRRGHGRVNARAFDASFDPAAPPYLVAEATEQLAHPSTTFKIWALASHGRLTVPPAAATLSGVVSGTVDFEQAAPGVFQATVGSGPLSAGAHVLNVSAEAPPRLGLDDNGSEPDQAPEEPTTTTTVAPDEPSEESTTTTTTVVPEETTTTTTVAPDGGEGGSGESMATPDAATTGETGGASTETTESTIPGGRGHPGRGPAETATGPGSTDDPTTTGDPTTTTGTEDGERGTDEAQADGLLRAAVPVRVLRADDQAPGVPFFNETGATERTDSLQGGGRGPSASSDVDDVWSVPLAKGEQIRVTLRPPKGEALRMALYAPGTTDVWGQWDRIVAQPGTIAADGSMTLTYTATQDGDHLVDVYALGMDSGAPAAGQYTLSVSVTSTSDAGPVNLTAGWCSPNGDGLGDICKWAVNDPRAKKITSTVMSRNGVTLATAAGGGEKTWDGTDSAGRAQPDGNYLLRVTVVGEGGDTSRLVTYEQSLIVDRVKPTMANPDATPNPFEPFPKDGDRDTVTFSAVTNEYALLRVFVYDTNNGRLRKTVQAPTFQGPGRITAEWDGIGGEGEQLARGTYDYLVHVIDPAGNRVGTSRIVGLRIN